MSKIKFFIISFQIIFIVKLSAQFTPAINGISSFHRMLKSETYFVLTGNKIVDNALKKEVVEYWNITPYHFISEDSFYLCAKDIDKSFVYIKKLKNEGVIKPMKTLCLVNGGFQEKAKYLRSTLAYVSLDNEAYESNDEDIVFRLGHIISQLQEIVLINKEENIKSKKTEFVLDKYINYYNKNATKLKDKTLLIDVRYLSKKIVSRKEFESIYKYNLEFVEKKQITKAIKENDATKAYLISALNLVKINSITDCATGKILFLDFEEENDLNEDFDSNFDKEDIKYLYGKVKAKK